MALNRARVMCVVGCTALTLVALPLGQGCSGMFAASFQRGADDATFGTLIDDRGTFEFVRNTQTGNLQEVRADNGVITLPTDGQDFGVARDDGSSLNTSPAGDNDVLIAVRNDPGVGNADFQVSRESLGDLGGVVRQPTQLTSCADNQAFLDEACVVVNSVDLAAVSQDVNQDLTMRGEMPPSAEEISALLLRYLIIPVDCCLAWDEFRNAGGDACGA